MPPATPLTRALARLRRHRAVRPLAPLRGRRPFRAFPLVEGYASRCRVWRDEVRGLPATGNRQRVAGDVARLVRGEEQDSVRYLDGLAEPTQRRHAVWAVFHRLIEAMQVRPDTLRLDRPWGHSIDRDAILCQLQCHVPDKAMHPSLRCGVGR